MVLLLKFILKSGVFSFFFFFYRKLPGELVTVITQLKSALEADSRMAEAYVKILAVYGHPPPFRTRKLYEIWVSKTWRYIKL